MASHCTGLTFTGLVALSMFVALSAPLGAGERLSCRVENVTPLRVAADRSLQRRNFAEAARWYLAAARTNATCGAPSSALLTARSLAQAGAALAQGGDELGSLALLREAQARFRAIPQSDRQTADAARGFLDLVERMIAAVEELARESM